MILALLLKSLRFGILMAYQTFFAKSGFDNVILLIWDKNRILGFCFALKHLNLNLIFVILLASASLCLYSSYKKVFKSI